MFRKYKKTATKLLLKGFSCNTCSVNVKIIKPITGWHCIWFRLCPKINICKHFLSNEISDV